MPAQDRVAGNVPLVSSSGISDTHYKNAVRGPGVVTGRSGSIGNVFFIEEDFWPLNTVLYVKDFHGNDPKFISYLLQKFDLLRFASGVGVPTLNRNFVHDELINIPLFSEQKRIVTILDEAFEGISIAVANAEKNFVNVKDLLSTIWEREFKSTSEAAVSVSLSSVCEFENGDRGKNYPGKEHRTSSGIPFINAGHLTESGIDHSLMDFISVERFNILGNGKIKPNDILFCLRGSLGKFASVDDLKEGAIASSLVILRPKMQLSHGYLLAYLSSKLCTNMIKKFKGGAAQPNLGAKDLGKFKMPLLSMEEQERVTKRLDVVKVEVKRLEVTYRRKLFVLSELKQVILQKAFAGELTTQSAKALEKAAE